MTDLLCLATVDPHQVFRPAQVVSSPMHVRIVPHIDAPGRSVVFDVFDKTLTVGSMIKFGRIQNEQQAGDCMSFKNKVVSRSHCKIWLETDGKLYLQDTRSSSGTFLNHGRLSQPNQESKPHEISHGDIVQLGVDYQGGTEALYRAVKMKFELNQSATTKAYGKKVHEKLHSMATTHDGGEVDECCICLYAIAPNQALFVAPCSHSYHFKCIRPLLQSYPGFQCPLCRAYSDLEASVDTAQDECVAEEDKPVLANKRATIINTSAVVVDEDSASEVSSSSSDNESDTHPHQGPSLSTTLTDHHGMTAPADQNSASSSRRRSAVIFTDMFKNIGFGKRRSLSAEMSPPQPPPTDDSHTAQLPLSRQWSSRRSLTEINE